MEGFARRDVGRPSKIVTYLPQVAQWLREDPHLSSAEILRRLRLAGYLGGKSALYKFVSRLRVRGFGFRRCPQCRALLRDIAEICRHCGLSVPSAGPPPPIFRAGALRAIRSEAAVTRRLAPRVPVVERYLVVAAAGREKLYEYFTRKFGRTAAIEVVPERRTTDRRERAATVELDRRRQDRRIRPALHDELRAFGFAIVARD